jgi:hypothetical protein
VTFEQRFGVEEGAAQCHACRRKGTRSCSGGGLVGLGPKERRAGLYRSLEDMAVTLPWEDFEQKSSTIRFE